MENPFYEIVDIMPCSTHASGATAANGTSRHQSGQAHHSLMRGLPHRPEHPPGTMVDLPTRDIVQMAESLDRKYRLTEDTVFWTMNDGYNVVFIIDMSQSMYSLDPNTNDIHIQTALETLEKCLMGMIQPFTVQSALGLPDYPVKPHICASVVGYCSRPPGSYPAERGRKKLPFCRTLAHAHMVTIEGIPEFMKTIRNFMYNYECEIHDMLGSFPPPMPPIPLDLADGAEDTHAQLPLGGDSSKRRDYSDRKSMPFESAESRKPVAGDTFTFKYDPDAPLLHTLQIADYFLKVMPEVCSPAFVYLTDGVMRSNFAISKAQTVTSSLARRNTQCTFVQVGSSGGFTPETTLGFVGDSELLLYLAASLDGSFVYASDCPDTVLPYRANFYHQVMLVKETRLARTAARHRYDLTTFGGRRPGDMPRERLDTKKEGWLQSAANRDTGFPWCAECKPPVVDTVTAGYSDYLIPININMLVEARMSEGFTIRSIQVHKLDREGLSERVSIKLELVWHPNITIIYRITNTHYKDESHESPTETGSVHSSADSKHEQGIEDRGQRNPNMVDIVIRSYKLFTSAFLHWRQSDEQKNELYGKAAMLHTFLKTMVEKDERLRQMFTLPPATSGALRLRPKHAPPVFVPPVIKTATGPRTGNETIPLGSRVFTDEVDPSVFLKHTGWGAHHWYLYELMQQQARPSVLFKTLSNFRHTTSMFIESDLILSYVDGINFVETAKHGQRIMNDFRAHVCQAGTWALLKEEGTSVVFLRDSFRQSHNAPVFVIAHWQMATNWILRVSFSLFNGTADARKIVMDCLPTFSDSFRAEYRGTKDDSVARATRPLHLLPVDLDISDTIAPNLLSTRDIGDLHTYVLEWRWTYLAREGRREDLSGEGSDREIVRQALHRLALTLGFHRLGQDFTLLNAKGESTGLMDSPGADAYDSCLTFYHEREGYDGEELLLACQYQIVVDMKQSSVTARTWIEPWSARFIRMVFEDDFRLLAPLGTFQQILQPQRCFQLKVPNLAEFHSRRMNMFSIMAVVNRSRVALRILQLPDITPAYAIWSPSEGVDDIKVDDPTYKILLETDPDEEVEIHELDENDNVTQVTKGTEYYKTHDREETRKLAMAMKLRIKYVGSQSTERRATLLERFMLTLFDKSEEGKYDPHIEEYRSNEYNPFILAMINPGHKRKLFFNQRSIDWMSTGEFTMVAYRCFLEFALFKRCDAISVNAERFNKLRFASSIVGELTEHVPGLRQATGVPNALDEHLYMDKWYVIRLPNNSSFLMVILPNVSLSSHNRRQAKDEQDVNANTTVNEDNDGSDVDLADAATTSSGSPPTPGRQRADSVPASPPVFTPALEDSIKGRFGADLRMSRPIAINAYTLVMECSMDNAEMRRYVRVMDMRAQAATKTTLNLRDLDVTCTDTKVPGEALQGFVGQNDVPIPFTEYALTEIKKLERMYSETLLQTVYLALLMKRNVALDDLTACQQSSLWKRRSIDVDITAFLHSQDVARISRDTKWQAQDRQSLQDKFVELLSESFTPLPHDVDPTQGRYYYCKSTPEGRSELEICLQLAQNPLFINLQWSVEVLDSDDGHEKRLNMPMDGLPLSLERLCEQAGIPWRPPTDHFEPLSNVRVIMHINCLYLPDDSPASDGSTEAAAEESGEDNVLEPKPDKQQLESRSTRLFQKTMSLASLVSNEFDPAAANGAGADPDSLPSAVIAKQHINAQMATLQGLPHDQLELVRHCHRRFVRFIAQETLYALRDIRPATVPLLNQVWHTVATTVDDDVPSDKYEFSHNKIDLKFLTPTPDEARRRHAIDLVMAELLKQDGARPEYPLGRLRELGGIVYMRDVRSRLDRIQARERIRARALSDAVTGTQSSAEQYGPQGPDLADAIPSWFLIKPTSMLDGVRILTHNYSVVTTEAADNALAATRQLLMVALKAANTRLLLEQMAETHKFPEQLVLPDAARNNAVAATGASRMGSYTDTQVARDEAGAHKHFGADRTAKSTAPPSRDVHTPASGLIVSEPMAVDVAPVTADGEEMAPPVKTPGAAEARPGMTGDPYDIASVLKQYTPDDPDFYACEEQFSSTFPLHPRISPNKAVQAVLSSGMMNNRLANQRNMFFVRDGDSIFYALLTIDRMAYVNPFGTNSGAASIIGRQSGSVTSAPTPTADTISPMYTSGAPGAHTVATTSPDPSAFLQHTLPTAQLAAVTADKASGSYVTGMFRRPSFAPGPPRATAPEHPPTENGEGTFGVGDNTPVTPRGSRPELFFNSMHRYSVAESAAQHPASVAGTAPASPSTRYIMSSLTNLEHERWNVHSSEPHSPLVSNGPSNAYVADPNAGVYNYYRLPHTVSITSMPMFDSYALNDAIPALHAEEKSIPCIVLHIYGVDRPRRDMTQSLVQQISERITVNVTMPEMSNMLLRRVALNDHDINFLFPQCNPEPTVLYLPLPRFVHDLDRLMLHMRQAFGEVISPFPASEFLAKAMRRTYMHLRKHHAEDDDNGSDGSGNGDEVTIGDRIPTALRNDLSNIMDGWEYDRQTQRRLPIERLTFLYNFHTKSGTPLPEMTDIGTGIAIISAMPLTRERVLSKGIWERLPPPASDMPMNMAAHLGPELGSARLDAQMVGFDDALMISTTRRPSLAPHQRQATSPLTSNANVEGSAAVSPNSAAMASANISPMPKTDRAQPESAPLPATEASALFSEYLRQFKEARKHLRVDKSELSNIPELMDEQVSEFAGEPVLAITVWSIASVRLDRLSAFVSSAYWNALGDYVSEQVLYPILSSGWGSSPNPVIKLPDPFVDLDACIEYPCGSRDRTQPPAVTVQLGTDPVSGKDATQVHLALLRTRAIHLPQAPSTFTENSKRQVHAMDIARQMAQYWGRQEAVRSLRYHRQKLPRVTGILHWFSEELRGVLEAMCPAMHPTLFRLLENPLVLDEADDRPIGPAPKSLFPAYTLRTPAEREASTVVYDISALPKALKGTRQSFCIMCTLPLDGAAPQQSASSTAPVQQPVASGHQSSVQSGRIGASPSLVDRTPPTTQSGSGAATQNRRLESLMKRPGESGYQRPSARTASGANATQVYGLGLHGWNQGDGRPRNPRYNIQRYTGSKPGEGPLSKRHIQSRLAAITERSTTAKRLPSPTDYKPIADPETTELSVDEIAHYATQDQGARVSKIAWIIVWLVGGELEMVGYNVSRRLWDSVCDQIKQRLERESRRKQLLGMFASHMGGIFPGYDRQARHRDIASTWLDRDVTRDLINKFALLKQLACDDQIHYFNIERQIPADYMKQLGLYDGSAELAQLVNGPPVAGMTLNDSKTELVLRQLQPEHLRWARKLTFVDYTQPYVDTHHPDTLFRIGSRFMRAYQGRITQVLRYDELMKIAERWRQLALPSASGLDARLLSLPANSSDTRTSSQSSNEPRHIMRSMTVHVAEGAASGPVRRVEQSVQAPLRGDPSSVSFSRRFSSQDKGKALEHAASDTSHDDEVTLEDIRRILENARLLHFVCAPLPVSTAIRPSGTDQRAFKRLFRVVSAMLQDLADCYIDYLCSTGYVVARRYEKPSPWRDALARLGYESAKIAQFTSAVLGGSYTHKARSEVVEATLPSIQIPGAYLFVNTERSNLVTDIEVSPEMLSIRMHALSRFTSEWRSAVPGYVKSSVSQRSIKKFTFELSKFKKLLHAKSFVYDFQLRYAASLLRPIASAAARMDSGTVRSHKDSDQYAVYSSDSDIDSNSSPSEGESSDVGVTSDHVLQPHSRSARRQRTVAQVLHVHVDLTLFMRALSQQRYYSTRFSSRRLVRAQYPVIHREMYEYFLDHSERYHFYTDGCRPPLGPSGHSEVHDGSVPIPTLCPGHALHSGCYRLYEGVLPENMQGHFTDEHMLGPFSEHDGYTWPSQPGDRFALHLSDATRPGRRPISIHSNVKHALNPNIASSAPEPTWKQAYPRGSSAEDGSYGRRAHPLATHGNPPPVPGLLSGARVPSDSRRSTAASFAAGFNWPESATGPKDAPGNSRELGPRGPSVRIPYAIRAHKAAPVVTAGQYVNVHAAEHLTVSSPLREGSTGSHGSMRRVHAEHDDRRESSLGQLVDFAVNEYSACRIHLLSNDSSVRVTLMALTPDCDTCCVESSLEAQRRKKRLYSHDQHPASADDERPESRRRHRRHQDRAGEHAASDREGGHRRSRHHHRRNGGKVRAVDNMTTLFGSPRTQFAQSQNHAHHPYHSTMASGTAQPAISQPDADMHVSLKRWMSSLSANIVVDPYADGLRAAADDDLAQISYYLIIDMDPQTTVGLSSLHTDDIHSRNGSLGPESSTSPGSVGNVDARPGAVRTCEECSRLARQRGCTALCGIHKALRVAQVDMRDWESRGEVWANEPAMLMDASTVDPDEYDKEDPDVLLWIRRTAKRLVAHTALDYHRDFNWYLAYQHVRMADLPSTLAPRDIGALLEFIGRQSWVDVGESDSRVQELLALDIPAQRIIESLQLRMRHLYLESTLLMTTLQGNSTADITGGTELLEVHPNSRGSNLGRPHFGSLGRALASAASINATPPATPTVDAALGLSRFSTADHTERAHAANDDLPLHEPSDSDMEAVNMHVLPNNPLCPIAAVDVHGRVVADRSSSNIDSVLRLLSPLHSQPSRRALLDPAFQKVLSRYIRLDMIDSPWLCHRHRVPITVPVCNWSLGDPSDEIANETELAQPVDQRVRQVQGSARRGGSSIGSMRQRRSRTGASIVSLGMTSGPSSSQSPAIAIPDAATVGVSGPAHSFATHRTSDADILDSSNMGGTAHANDRFARPLVESQPGTLLVVDPAGSDNMVARLLVLNPFTYHGMLELLFERSIDDGGVKLSQIHAVARCRRRDGLYEYERKHINMVMSTISAVVWDVVTEAAD
ncbi:hypothetical protein IW147_004858 [Coemansia sp. RSA 720]|nr:hypothetical protein IW147_004858 [Coemansia sp. RSA 720]